MTEPIAIIPQNAGERIQVSIEEFKGRRYVDLRTYYEDGDEWKPTRKGLAIPPDLLRKVIDAMAQAEGQVRKAGVLA